MGSHVVRELRQARYGVVVLDNLQKGHRAAVADAEFVLGDIADQDLVNKTVTRYGIEAVVHLAADSLVGESMQQPGKYFRHNVGKGAAFLEALAEGGVKYFVFSSTAAVYGEPREIPITEEHPTRPTNVYGATKLMIEEMLRWYEHIYGLRWISLRYFNAAGADPSGLIGEDHHPETHLIPLVLQTALGKRPVLQIYGDDYPTPDGTCLRDYIHVTDLSTAHVLALEALAAGSPSAVYNLGNGNGFSVREVIRVAEQVVGRPIPVEVAARRAGDPAVLVASSARIKAELNWRPRYNDLETIIRTAWAWHRQHPDGFARIMNIDYSGARTINGQ
ncbi:MAG: UDP-glucose 4-epimerase GalE [Firmicutes bacterium]|nr:UDP-glucose 4-epimerase GalE [Bacillota bacterium]